MRPDIVKFHHRQLSFIDETFHHENLPKTIQLFSVLFNAAVLTTRVEVHSQFIFTVKADIQMFEMKITVIKNSD